MSTEKRFFGRTESGKDVYLFLIKNSSGAYIEAISYGATLKSVFMPDKNGILRDVVLGFDDIKGHEERSDYQGQTVGRYANRIASGRFTVNGETFDVTKNENGETCLHGGGELSHAVWDAESIGENVLRFSYVSPDGSNGFPGEFTAEVTYTLTENNEIVISYRAFCTKDTPINLTNHSYFNLGGFNCGNVLSHSLKINASYFTPTDKKSIPTGEKRKVCGTPFDFTSFKQIGRDIAENDEQLINCKGYDHNFCLDPVRSGEPSAEAFSPDSGIKMEMFTDMPGVQLYTGNFLSGIEGKGGTLMNKHSGFCLETQYYPDTPNKPEFPQCTFKAGEEFISRTSYKFSLI
ncbi:MAG: galactose mutarotase [Clostridiales bacterium]|nr:galactose mutarotase [Clostridiales bacterium]